MGDSNTLPEHLRTGDEDLSELLQELRVLLPGTQTLTAFLIILPFNSGFADIQRGEKFVYLATFLCSLASLILFAAPAAQHRLQRPLRDREAFKHRANQLVVAGLVLLSLALVLATQLVLDQVMRSVWIAWGGAGAVALLILAIWWLIPLRTKARRDG
jgi:Na+/proline symporter